MILAFDKRVFDKLTLEVSVFGEMAFRVLGIPEKGFREFEFDELTCNRFFVLIFLGVLEKCLTKFALFNTFF